MHFGSKKPVPDPDMAIKRDKNANKMIVSWVGLPGEITAAACTSGCEEM